MRNQTKESRRLKDLIRIGVFSALWVVIGFLVAFTIGFSHQFYWFFPVSSELSVGLSMLSCYQS